MIINIADSSIEFCCEQPTQNVAQCLITNLEPCIFVIIILILSTIKTKYQILVRNLYRTEQVVAEWTSDSR